MYLAQLLEILAPQLINKPLVELMISDNSSSDDTPAVVKSFIAQGLSCRYIRNESNIGPDANFLQCFEKANGKYVWIFGDDDVIEPTGLGRVLSHLQFGEEYDLVFVKAEGFKGPYTAKVPPAHKGVTVFDHAEDLACYIHVYFTFISGNIINRDRVRAHSSRKFTDLVGTNLVQLGWVYTALEHHQRSLVIHDRLVATLANNTGGYALFKVFGPGFQKVTETWLTSERVKRVIIHGVLQRFFPSFLLSHKLGSSNFAQENPHQVLGPVFGQNIRYWLFDFPIIRMPRTMGRLWFWMVLAVNKIDKMLGSPLLRI